MKRWSLKVKVGAYAAILTLGVLVVAAGILMSVIYFNQLAQLDTELKENADELFRDLQNFRGSPVDPRRPLSQKFVPLALRQRYLEIFGPEGQVLYRSPNLGSEKLGLETEGLSTVQLFERNCRIGLFREGPYLVGIGTRLGTIERFQHDLRFGLLVSLPLVGVLVFGGGLLLGRRAVAPVAELTRAAERISANRPEERLPVPLAGDEIARLTHVLNHTFDRLQASYQSAARFSADASHQLKTPVAVLRAGLDELRKCDYLKAEEAEEVNALLQQTRRLTALIEDLLLLAQADAGRLVLEARRMDLVPLLAGVLDDLSVLVEGREIALEMDTPETLEVMGDARRIGLVLQNLVENAAKYTGSGGRISCKVVREGAMASIVLGNSGEGIPEEEQERIFERFRRGTKVGEEVRGHGLGLNIARELARAHGGDLTLLRSGEGWTAFEFRLPLADEISAE